MNKTRQLFGAMMLLVSMLSLFTACGEKVEDEIKTGTGTSGTTSLSVSPSSLSFSGSGGRLSLKVSTIYDYIGADTSADWLDYDFNDALNTMYITATANPTDKTRNATLTVMGSNDGNTVSARVTVKVEQEAGKGETSTTVIISPSGGKVELGDISIEFPGGTFKSSSKVTVSEVGKGEMCGDGELSKFYKLKLSEGVTQKFKVSVKSDKFSYNDYVKLLFTTDGWAPSINKDVLVQKVIDVKYADGAYIAEIPAMENTEGTTETEVYFGLTTDIPNSGESSRTRAETPTKKFEYHPWVGRSVEGMSLDEIKSITSKNVMNSLLERDFIPDAIKRLEDLGFKKGSEPIHYYGSTIYGDVMFAANPSYGFLDKSIWGKESGVIYLNVLGIPYYDREKEWKSTVIHETFHYYQQFYGDIPNGHNFGTLLDEAASSWSERYYLNGNISENTAGNIDISTASLNPDHYKDVKGDQTWSEWLFESSYQNIGYGAASLLEYLTNKLDESIVLKMYEERKSRKSKSDRQNSIDIIGKTAKDNGVDIFSQKGFKDYMENLGTRKVFYGITFQSLLRNRKKDGSIGEVKKKITDNNPVYFTNYAYDYGALVEELTVVPDKFNGGKEDGLTNTVGFIEQTTAELTTWVYFKQGNTYKLIGETEKGVPLDISKSFVKKNNKYEDHIYILLTIPKNITAKNLILSNIVTKVDKINKVFDKFKTLSLDVSGTCNYKGNWSEGSYVEKEKRVSYQMSLWDQKPNVEISHNANFVKISLNLKIDNSVENTDYNVILNIDATKNIITSLEAKKTSSSSFFESSENAIIRVENIPLMKVDGNNYISHNGYGNCVGKKDGVKMLEFHWFTGAGEVNDDWKWDGADDYQIFIDILLND